MPFICFGIGLCAALTAFTADAQTSDLSRANAQDASRPLAVQHVTVVDVASGRLLRDQTVIVLGQRVAAAGPSSRVRAPAGAVRINGRGKFLIPGLWDMHSHVVDPDAPGGPEVSFPLFVANGVTGIRDMATSSLETLLRWRTRVRTHEVIGPRMVVTGPILDGPPLRWLATSVAVRTPEDARRLVDSLAAEGADFIKVYELLVPQVFSAVLEQAKLRGLPVVGHVPAAVDAVEASDAGVRSFEHLANLELACSAEADTLRAARTALIAKAVDRTELTRQLRRGQRGRAMDTYDAARCGAMLRRFAHNGTWQVPTLINSARRTVRWDRTARYRAALRFVPPAYRAAWEPATVEADSFSADDAAYWRRQHAWYFRLVKEMRAAHVPLLAGTDLSTPWIIAGFALHEELALLVEAGLTPLEALRTATLNPAKYFGETARFGSVAPGKLADMVLLDADPIADIRNTSRIRAVIADGRYLDRRALDALLAQAERAATGTPVPRPGR